MDSRKREEQQAKAAGSPLKYVKMSRGKFGIMPLTNPGSRAGSGGRRQQSTSDEAYSRNKMHEAIDCEIDHDVQPPCRFTTAAQNALINSRADRRKASLKTVVKEPSSNCCH